MPCPTLPHLRSYEGADDFNKATVLDRQGGEGVGAGGREARQVGVVVKWCACVCVCVWGVVVVGGWGWGVGGGGGYSENSRQTRAGKRSK